MKKIPKNITTVDLDKNWVVPVPIIEINGKVLTKKEIAEFLADKLGYQEYTEQVERKEFEGSKEDFDKEFKGIKEPKQIIQIEPKENGNVKVYYQVKVKIPNGMTKFEFGNYRAFGKIANEIRDGIMADFNNKIQSQIDDLKALAEQQAQQAVQGLDEIKPM